MVLDEPNSNLDRLGDEALASAIDGMRARGQAVVLVSHRVQAIGKADLLLYIERGMQRAFGPRAEVMKLFQQAPASPARRADRRPSLQYATPGDRPAAQQQADDAACSRQRRRAIQPSMRPAPARPAPPARLAPMQRRWHAHRAWIRIGNVPSLAARRPAGVQR